MSCMKIFLFAIALSMAYAHYGSHYGDYGFGRELSQYGYGDYGFGRQLSSGYGYGGYGFGRELHATYGYGGHYGFSRALSSSYGYGDYGRGLMQEQESQDLQGQASCLTAADIVLQLCADEELGGDIEFADQIHEVLAYSQVVDQGAATGATLMDMLDDTRFSGIVFVPTPAAFMRMSEELNTLGLQKVGQILQYHVAKSQQLQSGEGESQILSTLGPFPTPQVQVDVLGKELSVSPVDPATGQAEVSYQALVEYSEIPACNAKVFVVDRLLIPSTLRI